jgi:hypothetical protein
MPMPRKTGPGRRPVWTENHREALIGHDWQHAFGDDLDTQADNPERRAAWEELGPQLLLDWVKEQPFTRPHSWWTFDAPERRRCITGPHWHDKPETIAHVEELERQYPGFKKRHYRLSYGTPNLLGGPGYDFHNQPDYESERDYLIRLDLLTTHERELLAAETNITPAAFALATAD